VGDEHWTLALYRSNPFEIYLFKDILKTVCFISLRLVNLLFVLIVFGSGPPFVDRFPLFTRTHLSCQLVIPSCVDWVARVGPEGKR
jgi:hypothetical protein